MELEMVSGTHTQGIYFSAFVVSFEMLDAELLLKMNEFLVTAFFSALLASSVKAAQCTSPVAAAQLKPGVPAQSTSWLPLSCCALVGHSFFWLC